MDWSFELLPPGEQAVLRRLAVFPGTFTLAAVEAVVGTLPEDPTPAPTFDVVELLGRLVDKSMVTVWSNEPEVRFGLLESVREYAAEKLAEAGELEATRTRQRDYCADLVDQWVQEASYHRWDALIRRLVEDGGFTAALEWSLAKEDDEVLLRLAAAHWPYWYWTETPGWRRWLETALARCRTPSGDRVEALIGLATLLRDQPGESERCAALLEEAMENAQRLDSNHLVAQAGFYRSDLLLALGDRQGAKELAQQSLSLWDRDGFGPGRGWCHGELGWVALAEGDVETAAMQFGASLEIGEQIDDETILAHIRPALALVAALRGDHETARRFANDGIQAAIGIEGAPRVLMMALARAGQVAVLGNDPSAVSVVSRLLGLQRETGARYWIDEALELAGLALADPLPDRAGDSSRHGRDSPADTRGRRGPPGCPGGTTPSLPRSAQGHHGQRRLGRSTALRARDDRARSDRLRAGVP